MRTKPPGSRRGNRSPHGRCGQRDGSLQGHDTGWMNPCGGMLSFAQVATLRVCVGSRLRRPGCQATMEAEVDGGSRGKSCPRRSSVCYSPCQVMQGHGWRRAHLAVVAGPNPLPRSKARPRPKTLPSYNATPRRPLVKVELVHKAVSIARPRWLASLVRWTESRTSLGSVLKFAVCLDG